MKNIRDVLFRNVDVSGTASDRSIWCVILPNGFILSITFPLRLELLTDFQWMIRRVRVHEGEWDCLYDQC